MNYWNQFLLTLSIGDFFLAMILAVLVLLLRDTRKLLKATLEGNEPKFLWRANKPPEHFNCRSKQVVIKKKRKR